MEVKLAYRGPLSNPVEIISRLQEHHSIVAIDTETVSTTDRTVIGIGICIGVERFYCQVLPECSPLLPTFLRILANPDIKKVYHNACFDLLNIEHLANEHNLPLPDYTNIQDTMLMAKIQGREGQLETLATELLGYEPWVSIPELLMQHGHDNKQGIRIKAKNMLSVEWADSAEKCMQDCKATFNLYHKLDKMWRSEQNRECYEVDRRLISVLYQMEQRGLALNQNRVKDYYAQYSQEKLGYLDYCDNMGFNPGSGQQVGYILATRGEILPFTKGGKQLRTDEETLEKFSDPLAHLVLQYRKCDKLLGTYFKPYLDADRAYTHFRIDLATGRLASGQFERHRHVCRNLQNIPPSIRDIFEPDSGEWTNPDFSQLEMRVFAAWSGNETMLDAYREGRDIHAITHSAIFPGHEASYYEKENLTAHSDGERTVGKTMNFQVIFDASSYSLSVQCKRPEKWCAEIKAKWFATYPGSYEFIQSQKGRNESYCKDMFDRYMLLPKEEERGLDHVQKCRVNWPVQATGADIVKRSMLMLTETDNRLQIHDEFLINGKYDVQPNDFAKVHPDVWTPVDIKRGPIWK